MLPVTDMTNDAGLMKSENHIITVPQTPGKEAVIDQIQSCQATKKLGLFTTPEGSPDPHLGV